MYIIVLLVYLVDNLLMILFIPFNSGKKIPNYTLLDFQFYDKCISH